MPSSEIPLQHDMFTGELVDNRTAKQKAADRVRGLPQQTLMFSQSEIAQIGVNPHPRMDVSPGPLMLVSEDFRSEEEVERDLRLAAEALTLTLFTPDDAMSVTENEQLGEAAETENAPFEEEPANITPERATSEALAELTRVCDDIRTTVAAAPDVLRAQAVWLALATLDARLAGVDADVIAEQLRTVSTAEPQILNSEAAQDLAQPARQIRAYVPSYSSSHPPTRASRFRLRALDRDARMTYDPKDNPRSSLSRTRSLGQADRPGLRQAARARRAAAQRRSHRAGLVLDGRMASH